MVVFNPHDAVRYAWQYIDDRRRNQAFPLPENQNDCTSFVSQCLNAAGWPFLYTGTGYSARHSPDEWWCQKKADGRMSWTWGAAPEFAQFVQNSGRGTMLWRTKGFDWSKGRLLQPGDVLQQGSDTSGALQELHHTCIVLEVFPNDPKRSLIGQHSGSRSPQTFDYLMKTTSYWIAWRMWRSYAPLQDEHPDPPT